MNARLPLTNDEGEVRELTGEDLKHFRRADTLLPPDLRTTLGIRRRGPQRLAAKVSTTVRFDADVIAAFKATGKGWQTRMNDALKEWLNTQPRDGAR